MSTKSREKGRERKSATEIENEKSKQERVREIKRRRNP